MQPSSQRSWISGGFDGPAPPSTPSMAFSWFLGKICFPATCRSGENRALPGRRFRPAVEADAIPSERQSET